MCSRAPRSRRRPPPAPASVSSAPATTARSRPCWRSRRPPTRRPPTSRRRRQRGRFPCSEPPRPRSVPSLLPTLFPRLGFSIGQGGREMEHLYLWPTNRAASLLALFILSNVFLYAARLPMHKALREMGRLFGGAFRVGARACRSMAAQVAQRDREMIVEMGKGDLQAKVGKEFHRIEGAYAKELARYPDLHRKLDDVLTRVDADFQECATAAPVAPGWNDAVTAVAKMPQSGDGVVKKVLEEIHKSAVAGEKKALQEFREATAKKHKLLGSMAPAWKELKKLAVEVGAAVTGALESTKRIDGYMAQYE